MQIETDKPMPHQLRGRILKAGEDPRLAQEPKYERFECMDGPLAGRGLIVSMPASRAVGYNLYHTEGGDFVAYHADMLS